MKEVKLTVVRTIITEEYYTVQISDSVAKELESKHNDKDALADIVEDELQKSRRNLRPCKYVEQSVSDKVTFVKMNITEVKE